MRLMADATTAAKDRIDRALAALERKILELKARPASAPPIGDDDLFAPGAAPAGQGEPAGAEAAARIAELEQAGREASEALARATAQIRDLLAASGEEPQDADEDAA
jgi:hypothetical protein